MTLKAVCGPRGRAWGACEAGPRVGRLRRLEHWHNLGRGTLVVLDVVPESGAPSYEERRATLEAIIPLDAVFSGDTSRPVPCGTAVLTATLRVDHADALAFYQCLREANRALGCDFFEGVVMKRADSSYPVQTRSSLEHANTTSPNAPAM